MPATRIFIFVFTLCYFASATAFKIKADRVWSTSTREHIKNQTHLLAIFCYEPQRKSKSLFKTWMSATFSVEQSKDFSIYTGDNESHVHNQYEQMSKSWFQLFPYWTRKVVYLSPFIRSCIGVVSATEFVANLVIEAFDWLMFSCFVIGALLFLLAPRLSRNVFFYYGSGVLFGILASLLIVAFVVGRFIPKKSVFYSILFAGLSLSAYVWNYLYDNLLGLLETYHWYFLGYVAVSGLVSLGVCYYRGPVTNPRLLTIIQCTLQIAAIILMYASSQVKEVAVIFVILLALFSKTNARFPVPKVLSSLWYRMFPPRHRLLTEEEYFHQGLVETEKALEDLRRYCRSPGCNAWKTLSKLKSPVRFSKWVDGCSDHVTSEEVSEHETSFEGLYSYFKEEEDDEDGH